MGRAPRTTWHRFARLDAIFGPRIARSTPPVEIFLRAARRAAKRFIASTCRASALTKRRVRSPGVCQSITEVPMAHGFLQRVENRERCVHVKRSYALRTHR